MRELGEVALQAPHGRVAKRAEALAGDETRDVLHQRQVLLAPAAGFDAQEYFLQPGRAFATGRTLAAAFLAIEAERAAGDLHHGLALVDDDDAGGAEHGAGLHAALVVERRIQLVCGEQLHGDAAGHDCFHGRVVVLRAAAIGIDQLAHGYAVGQFVQARVLDVAAQTEDAHAGALLCAETAIPVDAVTHHVRDVGDGLHIVDDGGPAVQALDGRERRLHARVAAIAFQAGQQRGLFAALIRACAAMDDDVEFLACAEDVVAQVAFCFGFLDCLHQTRVREVVFAANVDEGRFGLNGVARSG